MNWSHVTEKGHTHQPYCKASAVDELAPGFWNHAIEEIVNDVVKKFFLTRERPRVSDLLQFFNVACEEQGLPMPNYRTVRRRLRTLDPKLVASKRFGAKAAREVFAPVHASSASLLLPLDVVQIDHTPADVIVVDEYCVAQGR
jgi:putative transposase